MKILHRILVLISVAVLYILVKEFLEIYTLTRSIHPILGYATILLILGFSYYFIAAPVFRIFRVPVAYGPVRDRQEIPAQIDRRMDHFKSNKFLQKSEVDLSNIPSTENGYQQIMQALQPEAERIREKYVTRLFYSSSIAQNGFLDAILIFSASVNLIKEIFLLYNGRVSNRDLLIIGRKVYYSIAIGGSEGIEYATDEIISKLTSDGLRGVPFADKVFGSIADGFVNAVLLTRVALITENYCKMLYVKSDRDLIPNASVLINTTRQLTADVRDQLAKALKQLGQRSWEKTRDYAVYATNPIRYVYEKIVQDRILARDRDESKLQTLKDVLSLSVYPFGFVTSKLFKR